MTAPACRAARAALLRGAREEHHLVSCTACSAFADRLARVDAALGDDGLRAPATPISAVLRERIVAATTGARTAPPARTGRLLLLDWGLRAAAAAAVLVAGAWLLPEPVLAADLDAVDLAELRVPSLGLADHVESRFAAPPRVDDADPVELPVDPAAAAAAGALLLAAGWALGRRNGR